MDNGYQKQYFLSFYGDKEIEPVICDLGHWVKRGLKIEAALVL